MSAVMQSLPATGTPLEWSEFSSAAADSVWRRNATWPELIDRIRSAASYAKKAECPWLKMATFGDLRTVNNSLRHNANVLSISGVEGDYDGEVMQPEEAMAKLERARIRCAVYTSPSHMPEKPRWRVLAPCSETLPPESHGILLGRINGVLGGVLSRESWTLSQSYYFGAVRGAEYRVLVAFDDPDDGHFIDELDELDCIAIGKPTASGSGAGGSDSPPGEDVFSAAAARLGRKLRTGDGRREMLKAFITSRSARGLRGDDIGVLIDGVAARHFDSADPMDEQDVAEIINWANGKDQAALDYRRDRQRKAAQVIGEGTTEMPPLAESMSLEEMLEQLVFISHGSRVAHRARPQISLPLNEFKVYSRASETQIGSRMVPTADLWVQDKHRVTTHTFTYRPGSPEFTTDPEGARALNLWSLRERPPSSASVEPFLEHVRYLVPDESERERFLSWLAHAEQFPGVLPHTHYLMVTPQTGIGRNWLASLLARVWAGATRLGFDLDGAMATGFNGALSRRLLVIVDELKASNSGYAAGSHAQQLKSMLTTEHRPINPKFGRQHIEFNCARWLMFSQHYDALPLERADRRVIVISNPTERMPPEYYSQLYRMLDDAEFIAAVGRWLAERDIRDFNPSTPAPLTQSKALAIEANVSDLERALLDLRDGTEAYVMTAADINEYLRNCGAKVSGARMLSSAYAATGLVSCKSLVTLDGKKHRVVALRDGARLKDAPASELLRLIDPDELRRVRP